MALNIAISQEADAVLVKVAGEVDVSNASELRDAINAKLPETTGELVVDLRTSPTLTPRASASWWAPPTARRSRAPRWWWPVRRETLPASSACSAWRRTSTSARRRASSGRTGPKQGSLGAKAVR